MGSFTLNEIMTNQSPVSGLFGVEPIESEVIEKQPVSLYRHSLADICILVNPSTKEIIPKQSSQVLDYMRTHHAQDSIQDLINDKTLVLVGGNNVSTKANLVSAGKIEEKDLDRDNDNLGNFMNYCISYEKLNYYSPLRNTIIFDHFRLFPLLKSFLTRFLE